MRCQFGHDRQAEARAGFGLVESSAALHRFRARRGREPGPVILDHDEEDLAVRIGGDRRRHLDARRRPLAGVVDEIADHLLEILALAAEA